MRIYVSILSIAVFGLLLTGCTSEAGHYAYEPGYEFGPQPALVDVFRNDANGRRTPLTVLVSVIGVRHADARANVPLSVEIRMRLEDHGPERVRFDPDTLALVTGSLQAFPPPLSSQFPAPPGPVELTAGQTRTITAFFRLPRGSIREVDLDHLRLRWVIEIDGQPVPQTALFERLGSGEYNAAGAPPEP